MVILLTPVPTQAEKLQEEGKVREMDPIRGQIQLGCGSRVLGSKLHSGGFLEDVGEEESSKTKVHIQ